MNCSQSFNIMIYKFSFCNKRYIAFSTTLEREFTSKSNQVSGNTNIGFTFTKIEWCTFNQVHINMV